MSGSWADDQSVAHSIFSSFKSLMAHKNLCKYFLLLAAVSRDAGRADLFSDFLPPNYPAEPTWHQHTHLPTLLLCTSGKCTEQHSARREQTPAQQCSKPAPLRGGGRKKFSGKIRLPHLLFFPSFKCQAPTQFLWKFEQLVRSVWKQNKPQHISPFGELSERQHALQSGDYSAFSSLGLGCRPKIQSIFLYICVESGLISD